jgi:hypothetical protein
MASAAPPSEYFEGINWNLSFYTVGDSSVTLNYVNSNFLKCTGYAYSRAIATTFNNIVYFNGGFQTTDITASGTITANLFSGSGAELTNLNASNISDGTLTVNRGGTGLSTLELGQLLIGNGPNPITQSANLIWDIQNNNLGIGKNPAQKLDVNGTVAATLFSGSGASLTGLTEGQIPALTAAKIPDLDAAKIATGTINNTRLPTNYGTQLGIGTSPAENTNLHIYNADNSTIRLETGANGTPGVEFQRGTINDSNVDFKIVNDTGNLKFLSQDEVNLYSATTSEIMRMTRTQISIYKDTQINGNVGIGTDVPATQLHIYKTTNPAIRIQSLAEGTPSIELMRGVLNDVNKDYRFVSESDIFKLQYQDSSTSYGNNINQLIRVNATDTIIHKPTEFKANVVISGDTKTIGYVGIGTTPTNNKLIVFSSNYYL